MAQLRSAVISGATGLVGTATARQLASEGFEVLGLGRREMSHSDAEKNFGATASYLDIQMSEIRDLPRRIRDETSFQGRDSVFFHFAWSGNRGLTDGGLPLQLSNATHAATVVEVAKEMGMKKIVTAGTIQETHLEMFLSGETMEVPLTSQQDYALAKLAARDMSKITAYLQKIDFVHTRLSVPLDFSLARGTYIALTLRAILQGKPYTPPVSNEIVDLVSTEDVAQAYSRLGSSDVGSGNFYIGSSKPVRLPRLFSQFEDAVAGRATEPKTEEASLPIFDSNPLWEAVGFRASKRLEEVPRDWTSR